jgi:hypothetical protein
VQNWAAAEKAHGLHDAGRPQLADAALAEMAKDIDGMFAKVGRQSIAPERLFRALLLQRLAKVDWLFVSACAASNLLRIPETAGAVCMSVALGLSAASKQRMTGPHGPALMRLLE